MIYTSSWLVPCHVTLMTRRVKMEGWKPRAACYDATFRQRARHLFTFRVSLFVFTEIRPSSVDLLT